MSKIGNAIRSSMFGLVLTTSPVQAEEVIKPCSFNNFGEITKECDNKILKYSSAIHRLLELDNQHDNVTEENRGVIRSELKQISSLLTIDYDGDNSDREIELYNRARVFKSDLTNDYLSSEGLFKIDYKSLPFQTEVEYILYILIEQENYGYNKGFKFNDLKDEFTIGSEYPFYYNDINNKWYDRKNIGFDSLDALFTESIDISNNQKQEYGYNKKLYRMLSSMIQIPVSNEGIVGEEDEKYNLNNYASYLMSPENEKTQHYAISLLIKHIEENNLSSIQFFEKENKFIDNRVDFSQISDTVTILKSDSQSMDYMYDKLSTDQQILIKNSVQYTIFLPQPIVKQINRHGEEKISEVEGLSIGNGVIYIKSNVSDNVENNIIKISDILVHEASHANKSRISQYPRLIEETSAFVVGKKFLESKEQSQIDDEINNDLVYYQKLIERSDFMINEQFGDIFLNVYPFGKISTGQLLRGKVNIESLYALDNFKSLELYSDELIQEFVIALDILSIAVDKKMTDGEKGEILVKKLYNKENDLYRYNAYSALTYLFPEKYKEIKEDQIYKNLGHNYTFDEFTTFYREVIKGNIQISGVSSNSGEVKSIVDLQIQGNIIDTSESTGSTNYDVGGRVEVDGRFESGNHTTTGKVTGNIEVIVDEIKNKPLTPSQKLEKLLQVYEILIGELQKIDNKLSLKADSVNSIEIDNLMNKVQDMFDIVEDIGSKDNGNISKKVLGELKNNLKRIFYTLRDNKYVLEFLDGIYSLKNFEKLQQKFNTIIRNGDIIAELNLYIQQFNLTQDRSKKIIIFGQVKNILAKIQPSFSDFNLEYQILEIVCNKIDCGIDIEQLTKKYKNNEHNFNIVTKVYNQMNRVLNQ